jgi:hypothetical protein
MSESTTGSRTVSVHGWIAVTVNEYVRCTEAKFADLITRLKLNTLMCSAIGFGSFASLTRTFVGLTVTKRAGCTTVEVIKQPLNGFPSKLKTGASKNYYEPLLS